MPDHLKVRSIFQIKAHVPEYKFHIIIRVRKDLGRLSSSLLLLKQVPNSGLHIKMPGQTSNISKRDSTTSLSSLFQCSVILQTKQLFLMLKWNLLFQFVPIFPCSITWRHQKRPGPSCPIDICVDNFPRISLFLSRLDSPRFLRIS